jgi:hypothetical protein
VRTTRDPRTRYAYACELSTRVPVRAYRAYYGSHMPRYDSRPSEFELVCPSKRDGLTNTLAEMLISQSLCVQRYVMVESHYELVDAPVEKELVVC